MKRTFFVLIMFFFIRTNAQNVGIGTTTPQVKLHVTDSISTLAEAIKVQGNSPYIGFYSLNNAYKGYLWDTGNGMQLGTSNASPVTISAGYNTSAHFLANGKVGIGTASPTQKLDVNGNMNVTGDITVNNIAGQPNQVLMTNSTGNTFWGDMGGYKKIASFTQNNTWTIPAGVTKVRIEAWGGGGGGASGGGGAGGTYILTQEIPVTAGDNITVTIGNSGAAASTETTNGIAGGQTSITGSFGSYFAKGGGGGSPFGGGIGSIFSLVGDDYVQIPGTCGSSATIEYAERTAGQFVEIIKNANGGSIAPTFNNGGTSGTSVRDLSTGLFIKNTAPPVPIINGTGGGGGYAGGIGWGAQGRSGMVIIFY